MIKKNLKNLKMSQKMEKARRIKISCYFTFPAEKTANFPRDAEFSKEFREEITRYF